MFASYTYTIRANSNYPYSVEFKTCVNIVIIFTVPYNLGYSIIIMVRVGAMVYKSFADNK